MNRKVLALLATAAVFLSPSAWANLIHYNVEVVSAGTTYEGSFAFDSTVVQAGQTVTGTDLLSQLSLDLSGIPGLGSYDATTANTGTMSFDSAGMLSRILFGSNCGPGVCTATVGQHWLIAWTSGTSGGGVFTYFASPGDTRYLGTADVSPVPEPGTLALLSLGLAGLGLSRRRKAD